MYYVLDLLNLKPLDSKATFQISNLALTPRQVLSIKTICLQKAFKS